MFDRLDHLLPRLSGLRSCQGKRTGFKPVPNLKPTALTKFTTPALLLGAVLVSGCAPTQNQTAANDNAAPQASAAAMPAAPSPAQGEAQANRPVGFGPPPTGQLFQRQCAACHNEEGLDIGGRIAVPQDTLKQMSANFIYESMISGKMQVQATGLSDRDMRAIAEFASGKRIEDTLGTGIENMANRCESNPPLPALNSMPSWNGWSPTQDNARFQTTEAAGLTAAEVPKLKLKWAFGLPQGASSSSQPSVVAGRVFVGSDNATLYSLDAETGCGYWSFKLDSFGRFAPLVAPIQGYPGTRYAVYFVTSRGTAYAIDAQNGKELWKTSLQGLLFISASVAFHDGRLYVPITGGMEVFAGVNPNYECCKSRGGVASLDANTGELIWRVESIPEPLEKLGLNQAGTQLWGPSGAGIWNTPTVDPKRGLLYVGTGNNYGPVASSTSDSILALSMEDGSIQWHHQEFEGDAFMAGCGRTNPPGSNCPETLGPDWDFGGASPILQTLEDGRDILVVAGKGGVALGLDPDQRGKVLWRTILYRDPPTAAGLVLFGGSADGKRVYYPMQHTGGGLKALELATGKIEWDAELNADHRGQIGASTSIPGVVFTGGWDGILRAVDMAGEVIWTFNTKQRFESVNGAVAIGGSLGSPGPTVANGMVFVASGYPGVQAGTPGNVILAFGIED